MKKTYFSAGTFRHYFGGGGGTFRMLSTVDIRCPAGKVIDSIQKSKENELFAEVQITSFNIVDIIADTV